MDRRIANAELQRTIATAIADATRHASPANGPSLTPVIDTTGQIIGHMVINPLDMDCQ